MGTAQSTKAPFHLLLPPLHLPRHTRVLKNNQIIIRIIINRRAKVNQTRTSRCESRFESLGVFDTSTKNAVFLFRSQLNAFLKNLCSFLCVFPFEGRAHHKQKRVRRMRACTVECLLRGFYSSYFFSTIPRGASGLTCFDPTSAQFVDSTVPLLSWNDFIIAMRCSSDPLE